MLRVRTLGTRAGAWPRSTADRARCCGSPRRPGKQGYERFPYLLQALADLGVEAAVSAANGLWAFFDGSYRSRVDLDYFAERWRKAGIGALHVAGWHYFEPNPESDEYLRKLDRSLPSQGDSGVRLARAAACQRASSGRIIRSGARKPRLLQDAQLDWRKLMNLTNRDCFAAVANGVKRLIERFDWDGVNLAELYFESLEGASNPARFTPMNDDVRRGVPAVARLRSVGAVSIAESPTPRGCASSSITGPTWRAGSRRNGSAEIESIRASKPDLDFVLTHVDDRFDTRMRDLIGADAARVLPLLDQHDFTFLIEDPATIWNLGPQRYPQIAARYQPLTKHTGQAGHRHQYRRALPGRLSHQTANRNGIVPAGASGGAGLSASRAVLRELDPHAGPAAAASAAASVDKVEQDGSRVDRRFAPRRRRALARSRDGEWPAVAGAR